jgi:hypothetical protein
MNLEYNILGHLFNNDNGTFVEVTYLDENYSSLIEALIELKGNNYIVIDEVSPRNFAAFGISNQRKHKIRAKINVKGKIYYQGLYNKFNRSEQISEKKRSFKLAHFFNF